MEIVFAIPTFNRSDIVSKTLPQNILIAKKHGARIVLVNNASTDGTSAILSSYRDCIEILSNEKNIGLKGSFRRIISEKCNLQTLVIILSDEDVIDENGLEDIFRRRIDIQSSYQDSVLIFNSKNKFGRDFYPRRCTRKIQTWRDVEVFSFGLISGFGFLISKKTASQINWDQCNDDRNNYPHWGLMFDRRIKSHVVGILISRDAVQAKITNLDQEWSSKKNHWAAESVNDYLLYHSENYKSMHASLFRIEYRCIGETKNIHGSYLKKTVKLMILIAVAPRKLFYYFVRLLVAFNRDCRRARLSS